MSDPIADLHGISLPGSPTLIVKLDLARYPASGPYLHSSIAVITPSVSLRSSMLAFGAACSCGKTTGLAERSQNQLLIIVKAVVNRNQLCQAGRTLTVRQVPARTSFPSSQDESPHSLHSYSSPIAVTRHAPAATLASAR